MASPRLSLSPSQVTRLHKPDYLDFVNNHLNGDKPVIITGAFDEWKARQWTSMDAGILRQSLPGSPGRD